MNRDHVAAIFLTDWFQIDSKIFVFEFGCSNISIKMSFILYLSEISHYYQITTMELLKHKLF